VIRFAIDHPVTVSMVTLAVALFGVLAALRLPVDLLPPIAEPTLTLQAELPGAAPAEVEEMLARPLEEAVGVISGVERVVSRSLAGRVEIQLSFAWGRNLDFAALDVREQLDRVRLPEGATRPVVLRYDPNLDPILRLGLVASGDGGDAPEGGGAAGAPVSAEELRRAAEQVLERNLESVEGVAAVRVLGGEAQEIVVALDQEALFRAGLDAELVRARLAGENLNRAGGALLVGDTRFLVRVLNRYRSAAEIAAMVLRTGPDGRQVRLADVARVEEVPREREVITQIDGRDAVELAIYREGDANTVAVARRVAARLKELRERLPRGVELLTLADQSRFIAASAREVVNTALYGGVLAILVLFLFLRDLRSTAVIALSIPVSVLFALLLMQRLGISINIISLGGLALGMGMVVDSSIVVLEAIARRREAGESQRRAAAEGTREVAAAVIASTLTTCAVFFPIVFVAGLAGALFSDLALAVGAALTGSLLVALTLIPMLLAGGRPQRALSSDPEPLHPRHQGRLACWAERNVVGGLAWLLRQSRRGLARLAGGSGRLAAPLLNGFERGFAHLQGLYPPLLRVALQHRVLVVILALALFAAAWGGARWGLGSELIPELAQGSFDLEIHLADGTPIATTARVAGGLERRLRAIPGVERVAAVIGGGEGELLERGSRSSADARIGIATGADRRRQAEIMEAVRALAAELPDAAFEIRRPTLFSFEAPLEVELYGHDLEALGEAAAAVAVRLGRLPLLRDLTLSTRPGSPEAVVRFDPLALARAGLSQEQVARLVRNRLLGVVATRVQRGEQMIDVRVRGSEEERRQLAALGEMILNPGAAQPLRLRAVATVESAVGPSEIRRIGQERAIVARAELAAGADLSAAMTQVEEALADYLPPAGVRVAIGGQTRAMSASFDSLRFAFLLALFLVYLVMAGQFESLLHPLVILFTVPLGAIGVVAALALTGTNIDVVVLIGAVMLAGIVVNNSIVLVDAVNQRRAAGAERHAALLAAGEARLRPILMTTATTVLGLVPMALGWGEGGELRAPLAITVSGGLLASTAVSLLVVPVLYDLLDRLGRRQPPVAGDGPTP
jgi:HAE1 family hydrophobic/amphiphilic exporter-1